MSSKIMDPKLQGIAEGSYQRSLHGRIEGNVPFSERQGAAHHLGKIVSTLAVLIILFLAFPASSGAKSVTLAWDPNTENDLEGYKVHYNTGSGGPPYNGTGAVEGPSPVDVENVSTFTLTGLSDVESYHFVVTAYSTGGLESGYSNEVSVDASPNNAAPVANEDLPFLEDFESGSLAPCWATSSTGRGRIALTRANGPYSGNYHLVMDSRRSGTYSLNELILTLDLSGKSGVALGFDHKEFKDEDHVMPSRFSGSHKSDGVAVSADGNTWYKVQGLTAADGISSGWKRFEVDLDAAVAAAGIGYNSAFKIKFQQYDNYPATSDGFAFDEISLEVQ